MKVKYKGKWYDVAMTRHEYETGLMWYEIYGHSDTEQEHTEWIRHPEVVENGEDDIDDSHEDDVIDFENAWILMRN